MFFYTLLFGDETSFYIELTSIFFLRSSGSAEDSSFLKAVHFFLTELATRELSAAESCFHLGKDSSRTSHFSPREIDQYNFSKCTIIVRLLEFTTMILIRGDQDFFKVLQDLRLMWLNMEGFFVLFFFFTLLIFFSVHRFWKKKYLSQLFLSLWPLWCVSLQLWASTWPMWWSWKTFQKFVFLPWRPCSPHHTTHWSREAYWEKSHRRGALNQFN